MKRTMAVGLLTLLGCSAADLNREDWDQARREFSGRKSDLEYFYAYEVRGLYAPSKEEASIVAMGRRALPFVIEEIRLCEQASDKGRLQGTWSCIATEIYVNQWNASHLAELREMDPAKRAELLLATWKQCSERNWQEWWDKSKALPQWNVFLQP